MNTSDPNDPNGCGVIKDRSKCNNHVGDAKKLDFKIKCIWTREKCKPVKGTVKKVVSTPKVTKQSIQVEPKEELKEPKEEPKEELKEPKEEPTAQPEMNMSKGNSRKEEMKINKVFIYNDKELTTQLFEFTGIAFDTFEMKDDDTKPLGVSFDLHNMDKNNMAKAANYFDKITKKEGADTYKIYYSSSPECDILKKKGPEDILRTTMEVINPNVLSIGVTDREKKISYIAVYFQALEDATVDKYTKLISDSCQTYSKNAKNLYKIFNDKAEKYFKEKKERIGLSENADKIGEINTKNTKELDDLNADKKTLSDKLDADRKELEKLKADQAERNGILIKHTTEVNDLKEQKAKNDKLLEQLNEKLTESQNLAKDRKEIFDTFDSQKNQEKKLLDQTSDSLTATKKEIENLEKQLKAQDDLINSLDTKLNKLNTDLQNLDSKIADNKTKISKEQAAQGDAKAANVPGKSEDNTKNLDDIEKSIAKIKADIIEAENTILKDNDKIKELKDLLKGILNDPEQKIIAKKDLANKLEDEIKEYLDNLKQIYPLIPEIYFENIWKMVNVNHSESLNYLFGIRPTIFGLYDYIYSKKHPEIKINDVDYRQTKEKKIVKRKIK